MAALLYLLELSALIVLSSVAMWATGIWLLRVLRIAATDMAFTTILGMGTLGTLFVWLLILGQFTTPVVLTLLVATTGAGIATHWTIARNRGIVDAPEPPPTETSRDRLDVVLRVATTAVIVLAMFSCLDPFRGFDFRAYQYPMAAGYAESGGWLWFETLRFPTFPPLMNLWFATAILLGRELAPVLAQLLAVLPLFLVAGLLTRWAKELGASLPILAAALFIGSPLVMWAGTYGFVDVAMTAFTTGAVFALHRFDSAASASDWEADHLPLKWLVVCGVLVGSAMNVKYLGGFYAPFCATWLIVSFCAARLRLRQAAISTAAPQLRALISSLLAFGGPALATAAPWYLKTWIATGNPVFPFLQSVFGSSSLWVWRLRGLVDGSQNGLKDLANYQLRWDSYNPWLLPIAVIALAICLRAGWRVAIRTARPAKRPRGTSRPVLIELAAMSYFLAMFVIGTDRRYLLPAIALLSLLGAVYATPVLDWTRSQLLKADRPSAVGGLARRIASRVAVPLLVAGAFSALGLGFLGHKLSERSSLPPTPAGYEAYLLEHVRGLKALRWIQANENPGVLYRLGLADLAAFTDNQRIIGDVMGQYSYSQLLGPLTDIRQIPGALHEWGVDLVIAEACSNSVSGRVGTHLGTGPTSASADDLLTDDDRAMQRRKARRFLEEIHRDEGVCIYRANAVAP